MKKVFLVVLFTVSINSFGQKNFEKASFKNGDLNSFIAQKFFQFSKNTDIGYGKIIVAFEIDSKGKIQNLFPEKFNTKKNALNAILTIQATDNMWHPAKQSGLAIDKKYKIIFNLLKENSPYHRDRKKALKLIEKKAFKKALKIYNKLIARHTYNLQLYKNRYRVNLALNKNAEALLDKKMMDELNRDVLLNVVLFSKKRLSRELKVTTKRITGRDAFLRRGIKNQ